MPNATRSLKAEAYERILDRLLKNELRPGEIINRRQVAAELGMSVGPVLEAMVQLESEGFFEVMPRKGTRVRLVRPEDVAGNLIVREALECQAARMYQGERVAARAKELTRLARDVESSWDSGLPNWRAEVDFHRALVALAECGALTRAFDRVMRVKLFFQLNMVNDPRVKKDRSNHVGFVKALKNARTPDECERLVREHVRRGKEITR